MQHHIKHTNESKNSIKCFIEKNVAMHILHYTSMCIVHIIFRATLCAYRMRFASIVTCITNFALRKNANAISIFHWCIFFPAYSWDVNIKSTKIPPLPVLVVVPLPVLYSLFIWRSLLFVVASKSHPLNL